MPQIEVLDHPTPEDRAAIVAPLDEAGRRLGFAFRPEDLTLAIRHEGRLAGGAGGETYWGWLHVRILAVDEALRGMGWGRALMRELERTAVERGCHHAWVDTFSFQARPFYERLGYRVFGVLPDYPAGESRFFLAKPLASVVDSPGLFEGDPQGDTSRGMPGPRPEPRQAPRG